MTNIQLVIPDLFLPQPAAAEVTDGLALPALETALARSQQEALHAGSLEEWLCAAFGVERQAIASVTLRADGLDAGSYYWLRADPVHLSLQHNQLVLFADVYPGAEEAEQLCEVLNQHFAADGMCFFAPHPQRWYLRLEAAADIATVPLAQAEGGNVYEHLPQGNDALRWHGIFNEIQMLMHGHEVNQAREARGGQSINSVWLWGGGVAAGALRQPAARMFTDSELASSFAQAAGMPCDSLKSGGAKPWEAGGDALLVVEGLRRACRRGDLHAWREELQRLELEIIGPLLYALRAGRIGKLTLDVLQGEASRRFVLTRGAAWKLWRRPVPLAQYATH